MKLKNYSSGMTVRLAFSVMIQADADILLIDEVLAVGDAAFAQKCADVFHDLKDGEKTVVLVTHDMGTIEEYCDRAMLLHEGEIAAIGEPAKVAEAYMYRNFHAKRELSVEASDGSAANEDVRVVNAWIEDARGNVIGNLEHGDPINLRIEVEALRDIPLPSFGWMIKSAAGLDVSGFGTHLSDDGAIAEKLGAGERARIAAAIENPLVPGRYFIEFWMCQNRSLSDVVILVPEITSFVVYSGGGLNPGLVRLPARITAVPADRPGANGDGGAP
jgi:hypothetical protein